MHSSREAAKTRRDIDKLAAIAIDVALQQHRDLGARLLESVFPENLAAFREQCVPPFRRGMPTSRLRAFACTKI